MIEQYTFHTEESEFNKAPMKTSFENALHIHILFQKSTTAAYSVAEHVGFRDWLVDFFMT